MAAHRYWCVEVTKVNVSGNLVSLGEIELRTSVGGADVSGGMTYSASSADATGPAANAFDNNTATYWLATATATQRVVCDFGAGNEKDIVEFSVLPRLGVSSAIVRQWPVDFALRYSDTSNTGPWTTLFSVKDESDWFAQVAKVYSANSILEDSGVADRSYRLRATTCQTGTTLFLTEVQMFEAGSGTDSCSGGSVFSSSCQNGADTNVFDNVFTDVSKWIAQPGLPAYIGYKFPSAKSIAIIGITAVETPNHPGAPTAFVLEKWDGSAWVTVISLTGMTGWDSLETRYFNSTGETTAPVASSARPQVFICM